MPLSNSHVKTSLLQDRSILHIFVYDGQAMPKVSLDMPNELLTDLKFHVGDEKKFISVADAIRSACRKLLDQLDTIDKRQGRLEGE